MNFRSCNIVLHFKTGCILSVLLLLTSLVQAQHNYKVIGSTSANSGITQEKLGATDSQSMTLSGTGTNSTYATNDIYITYTTNNLVTSPAALSLSNNILTLQNGTMSFSGPQAAAHVSLTDNSTTPSVNTDNFNLSLVNNQLNFTALGSSSSDSLYGALFETTNSAPGVGNVSGNSVTLSGNGEIFDSTPGMIGGAISIFTDRKNITSQSNVLNNTVTVSAASNEKLIYSNITGGLASATIQETNGHKTYNLTNTVDGNIVTLNNGTFTGQITGGAATITTNAVYTATVQGNVQNNQVLISDGKYEGAVVIGGHAGLEGRGLSNESSLPISVHDNTISISGGKFTDALIIGGATTTTEKYKKHIEGALSNNIIEISGTPEFYGKTTLVGGYTNGTNTLTNNTLSLKTKNLSVYGLDNFNTYKFAVADANGGETFISVSNGDGHNQNFFTQYENSVKNHALNLEGVTIEWQDTSLAENGRPANLGLGKTITLISASDLLGVTGTIANNGVQTDIASGTETYSYKVVQNGNSVLLLHNGLATTGDWTQDVAVSAGAFSGGDSFMNIGGTLTAASVTVDGNAAASASLTAAVLDVTAQNTALTVNNTAPGQVTFNTINVGDGQTFSKAGNGFYSFNTMNIDGTGAVTAVDAMNATNTVNLTGSAAPAFDQINLGSGSTLTVSGGTYSFNSFNTYGKGATLTGNLDANTKNLNFYLDDTTAANDTALTVTGTADITDSTVKVGINASSSPLKRDDQVVLVDASSGLTGTPASLTGVGMQGMMLVYDFDLSVAGNQLLATVTKAAMTEESKSFLEGRAASLAFVGQGADFAAEQAMDSAIQAAALRDADRLALFTAFGGGKSRYETGSHIDVSGFNAAVGLSHDVSIFKADFMLASFLEYGTGSYNSYNSFTSGQVKGSGDTEFYGLGVLVRWSGEEQNTYADFSLRGGHVSTDFKGKVFFPNRNTTYDYNTFYYGGHAGFGYLYDWRGDVMMDFYARYLLTRQSGKDVTLSTTDKIRFQSSTSSRVRVGMTANILASSLWKPYVGVGYDYEFSGSAKASAYGINMDAPSLKGGTGVGSIGLTYSPKTNWTFGVGAEGYIGQRDGFAGNFNIGYQF